MPARLISGSLEGKVLIHQGFKYQQNRIRGDIIYWRCWKEECRAPLKTNFFLLRRPERKYQCPKRIRTPTCTYVRSAMTRARQELVPHIPWEVDEVEI
jgi:hypothetical protein